MHVDEDERQELVVEEREVCGEDLGKAAGLLEQLEFAPPVVRGADASLVVHERLEHVQQRRQLHILVGRRERRQDLIQVLSDRLLHIQNIRTANRRFRDVFAISNEPELTCSCRARVRRTSP